MEKPEGIYKLACRRWGIVAQLDMVVEECAELIQAVQKVKRFYDEIPEEVSNNFREELADVEIMIDQMKYLFRLTDKVAKIKAKKITRLGERLGM